MKSLRLVFMGTPEFALPSLRRLHQSHHQIVGVVTQPDRPRGRGLKRHAPPVKVYSQEHRLGPILQPERLKDVEFIAQLRELRADLFVVVAFRILPEAVFSMPPLGTVNLHPSLLPRYRGAAPIQWTLINGERSTGVTTIFITRKVDAGRIIEQKSVEIAEDETAGTLHDRLAEIGADLLLQTVNKIAAGNVQTHSQDTARATPAPKITAETAHLNFNQPASLVRQWIHGLSPFPGAYAFLKGEKFKFFRAQIVAEAESAEPPGTVSRARGSDLWIACHPGLLAITEVQREGKRRMSVEEFLRGAPLREGDQFK